MKKEMAIYHQEIPHIENGKFVYRTEQRIVRVIARAEGYAMVRNKGCAPFAVREKDLSAVPPQEQTE